MAVMMQAAGVMWGLISLVLAKKAKREKQAMTFVIAHFSDALDRPPISWVPPCVPSSQFHD